MMLAGASRTSLGDLLYFSECRGEQAGHFADSAGAARTEA